MFASVLVANRGEIAVRIIRTLRRLGIRSVVVASIPDRHSLAVRSADEWVLLEGYSPAETYLDVEAIIGAAKATGCEAIHPGYGFLSERPDFAEACAEAGLTFIGPPPEALRLLGDKATARRLAREHDVPVVPGYEGPDDDESLLREAERLGFPLMVKARGGGGGRGMREVHGARDLPGTLQSARREALAAFGDPGLFLERLIPNAHHVEVQVLGDTHGNLVHLGERDCTVQRLRQKLIEESPSPIVDPPLREALTSAALRLARAAGYVNAGTVEFLVGEPDANGQRPFYFLEVNPRLQVEHPVTEFVTGLDLVELQLRVAAGEPLPFTQDEVRFDGHAVEFRINAEDPWNGFRPSSGRLGTVSLPSNAAGARVEAGFAGRDVVPSQYDSLLAKLIVHRATRDEALDHGIALLGVIEFESLHTGAPLLAAVANDPDFRAGHHHVGWLEPHLDRLLDDARPPEAVLAAGALAAVLLGPPSPFRRPPCTVNVATERGPARLDIRELGRHDYEVTLAGRPFRCTLDERTETLLRVSVVGEPGHVTVTRGTPGALVATLPLASPPRSWTLRVAPPAPLPRRQHSDGPGTMLVTAPLAGTVAEVRVAEGDTVEPGVLLVVLEAMKMEHRITAEGHGMVQRVAVRRGDVVREGDVLVELA